MPLKVWRPGLVFKLWPQRCLGGCGCFARTVYEFFPFWGFDPQACGANKSLLTLYFPYRGSTRNVNYGVDPYACDEGLRYGQAR